MTLHSPDEPSEPGSKRGGAGVRGRGTGRRFEETEQLKQRHATKAHVNEAEQLIAAKARNMLRHYTDVVLPNGFKAKVVASSRRATVRYRAALPAAREERVVELDALDPVWPGPETLARVDRLPAQRAMLVRAWPYRDVIAVLDFVPIISGAQNAPADLAAWRVMRPRRYCHAGAGCVGGNVAWSGAVVVK